MNIKRFISVIPALLFVFCFAGCDESDSSNNNNSNGYVNIAGQWSGVYYETDKAGSTINLSATIQQDGEAVVISTTKSGTGGLLTGTIDQDGNMSITDAFDGEGWPTFYGPATSTHIKIADYLWDASIPEIDIPLAVIDLNR